MWQHCLRDTVSGHLKFGFRLESSLGHLELSYVGRGLMLHGLPHPPESPAI
jgi:hypothetical protein